MKSIWAILSFFAVTASSQDLEQRVMLVFESAGPGVVNITSRSISYDFFLRPIPQEGSGSGFVYDRRGHIVTNYHVIEGARELHVTFYDESRVPASVVGRSKSIWNPAATGRFSTSPAGRGIPPSSSRNISGSRWCASTLGRQRATSAARSPAAAPRAPD